MAEHETRPSSSLPASSAPLEEHIPTERPGRQSKRVQVGWRLYAVRLLLLVAVLGMWETSSGRWIDDLFVSRPSEIAVTWWSWLEDGTLWYHGQSTITSTVIGFAIGAFAAIMVGYALGSMEKLSAVFEPFITAGYTLPKIALVPLFVLWFGIGRPLEVAISAIITFFLMFYNVYFGVREVELTLINSVRIMGGGTWDIAFRVKLPSALVWLAAGLKISVPQALVGVVVAELFASNRGLGYLVGINAGQFNSAGTFAAILSLLVIGLAIDLLVTAFTRRALHWKDGS